MARKKRSKKQIKNTKRAKKEDLPIRPETSLKFFSFAGIEFNFEAKFRLIYFLPLFNGAFIVSGLVIGDLLLFSIIAGVIIAAFYCGIDGEGQRTKVKISNSFVIKYMIQIALCFLFFSYTKDPVSTSLLVLCALCMILHQSLVINSPTSLLLLVLSLQIETSLFVLLGIRSQLDTILWSSTILGFAVGSIIAAYQVLEHLPVLEAAGWHRFLEVENKRGETVKRPRAIARLFSLLLMVGLSVVLVCSTLGVVPREFFLIGATLTLAPGIAKGFLEESTTIELLKNQTLNLGVLVTIALLVVGQIIN